MHAASLALAALLAAAACALPGHEEHSHHPINYKFDYSVHDPHHGDVKSQHESGHGGQVKGSYSLVEPDGHIRKVEYTADKHNGFQAIVTRDGKTTLHGYGKQDEQGLDGGYGAGYGAGVGAGVGAGNGAGVGAGAGHGAGFGAGFGAGIGAGHSAGHGAGAGYLAGLGAGAGHFAGLPGVGHGNGAGYGAGYGAGFGAAKGHY